MLNPHWETIIPSLFFKVKQDRYTRQRIELEDGDFLDVDWIRNQSSKCIILSHGLEGGSDRYYMKRAAHYFADLGWDIAAWNCRSCSGMMNRLPRFYHHGDTADLDKVVDEVLSNGYQEIVLIGYSMGGSMSLKYLGEQQRQKEIKGAAVFSVPCNLRDSAEVLKRKENQLYEKRFLKKIMEKMKVKAQHHPEITDSQLEQVTDFDSFHDLFTAPLHGFANKEDFFNSATCDQFLDDISVPVLIVNAANDPMLGEKCYPVKQAERSEFLHLEIPQEGGHVGFTITKKPYSYMELRAEAFISSEILS